MYFCFAYKWVFIFTSINHLKTFMEQWALDNLWMLIIIFFFFKKICKVTIYQTWISAVVINCSINRYDLCYCKVQIYFICFIMLVTIWASIVIMVPIMKLPCNALNSTLVKWTYNISYGLFQNSHTILWGILKVILTYNIRYSLFGNTFHWRLT